jgi:hypothetical protein
MGRLIVVVVALLIALEPSTSARAASWLDGPVANWNSPGMAVPKAPDAAYEPPAGMCAAQGQPPAPISDAEKAVVAAGWRRVTTEAQWWGGTLVYAQQSVDGMCRPMQFQYFIFVDGKLAGTVSPVPMNSRTDGVGIVDSLRRDGIDVNYARYTDSDPLCCPSSDVIVRFTIERPEAGPVLVPQSP